MLNLMSVAPVGGVSRGEEEEVRKTLVVGDVSSLKTLAVRNTGLREGKEGRVRWRHRGRRIDPPCKLALREREEGAVVPRRATGE